MPSLGVPAESAEQIASLLHSNGLISESDLKSAMVSSEEGDKKTLGLGLIKTDVVKLEESNDYKLPHIGFNEVCFPKKSIFKNKDYLKKDFYFVHSFCLKDFVNDNNASIGHSEYKNRFVSFYKKDNLFATQFHPEKSQTNGLTFLKLFLEE